MDKKQKDNAATNVRYWRLKNDVMQQDLARKLGWSSAKLSQIEKVRKALTDGEVKELAHGMGVRVSTLVKEPPDEVIMMSRKDNYKALSSLKTILLNRHITYAWLSIRIGMSENYIKRLFSSYARPSIKIWWNICKVLGIRLRDLIDGTAK